LDGWEFSSRCCFFEIKHSQEIYLVQISLEGFTQALVIE
jgi:hypothetical protein